MSGQAAAVFVVADATGRILRVGLCPAEDATLQAGAGEAVALAADFPDQDLDWVNAGVVEPRPRIVGFPAVHGLAAGEHWTIAGVPIASAVAVDGIAVGTTDGSDLTVSFPEAGKWVLSLTPPWPWLPMRCEVTVS